jgi:RimJ/RimL family protein N-acetyltransferase
VLETPRLILRPFKESDAAAAHVWFSDPEVFRFYKYGPYTTLEQTAERVRKLLFSPCRYNRFVGTHIELMYELLQTARRNFP